MAFDLLKILSQKSRSLRKFSIQSIWACCSLQGSEFLECSGETMGLQRVILATTAFDWAHYRETDSKPHASMGRLEDLN
eukprot:4467435-Amphidinium_carterae.2